MNVLNSLDASHISTLCHRNHMDVDPSAFGSMKYNPSPSPSSDDSIVTSNQNSKRNRKGRVRRRICEPL
jgi:hypothetical protein